MKVFLSIIITLFINSTLFSQEIEEIERLNPTVDVDCYNLQIKILPQEKKISGQAILHAKSIDRTSGIFFDLNSDIDLEGALILKRKNSWDSLNYSRMSDKVSVVLPKSVKKDKGVIIKLIFSGDYNKKYTNQFNWNTKENLAPFVTENSTTINWWPCLSGQMADSMALSITLPNNLKCISRGVSNGTEKYNNDLTTHKWMITNPLKVPNIPIFIGSYETITKEYVSISGQSKTVEIWELSNNKKANLSSFKPIFGELGYLENKIGNFPGKNLKILVGDSIEELTYPGLISRSNSNKYNLSSQWFLPYYLLNNKYKKNNEAFLTGVSNYINFVIEDSTGKKELRDNMQSLHKKLRVQMSYPPPYSQKTKSAYYTSSLHTLNRFTEKNSLFNFFKELHNTLETDKWKIETNNSYKEYFFNLVDKPLLNSLANLPQHPDSIPELGVFSSDGKLKIVWKKPKDYLINKPLEVLIDNKWHEVNMPENRGEIPIKQGQDFLLDPNHWFFMKQPEFKLGNKPLEKYELQDFFDNSPWLHSVVEQVFITLTDTQKIAQMIVTSGGKHGKPISTVKNLVKQNKVGGVIFLKGNKKVFKTYIKDLDSINKLNKGLPLIYSMDAEPSLIKGRLIGFPETPKTINIKNEKECIKIANTIDSALLEIGVRHNFAPVCDVSPNNEAISNRSFGKDPNRVKKMALSYINATQKDQIIATAKHFPGHGMVKGDTHKQSVYIDGPMQELQVYEPLIKGGVISIMVAHIVVKNNPVYDTGGLPSSCSKRIITDLLKTEMGFEGLIVSDALNIMKAVTIIDKAPLKASMAGIDLILMPKNEDVVIKNILEEISINPYYKERVHKSIKKIIKAKICLGLL